jgi:cytochrome P450
VLSKHPEVWDGAAAGTVGVADVVEEVLRFRSAVTSVGRTVASPLEHRGECLDQGTTLMLSLWGADHDGAAYSRPETFDIAGHQDTPHMAFGYGAHHCLGAALARAELQDGLAALTARLSCPTVGDDTAWKPNAGITGPLRLPITFRARSTS